jgi:hypothetical protein
VTCRRADCERSAALRTLGECQGAFTALQRQAPGAPAKSGSCSRSKTRACALPVVPVENVGDLRPGLDGDIVIWSGDSFDLFSSAEQAFVGGRGVYPPVRLYQAAWREVHGSGSSKPPRRGHIVARTR